MQISPIRVDFGLTAPSLTSVTSESDHQTHVLQQYSLNQLRKMQHSCDSIQLSPRSQALQDLQKSTREAKEAETKHSSENASFNVPSPQLQPAEMWEGDKSIPTVLSHHIKPHSCEGFELNRQNLKVEPQMSPTRVLFTSPVHVDSDENSIMRMESSFLSPHEKPVLYDAWTVAKPYTPTRHSILTSTRSMHK